MHELYHGLDLNRLRLTPNHGRSFAHASYSAAAKVLLEATGRGGGFVVLTGAAGTGKTTLLGDLAARLERSGYCVGRLANSQVDADDLLQLVGFAFGLQAHFFSKAGLLSKLKDQLSAKSPPGRPAILIIDEAQDLAPAALEDLCLLGSLTEGSGPLVQILLSGRERIWDLLQQPGHEHVQQRILASCRLNPLTPSDTGSFISYNLELAGWRGDPEISADALRLIHLRTGGVPRLVRLTLSYLLLHGSLVAAHALGAEDVEAVLAQLGKDHPELLADTSGQPSLPQLALAQPLSNIDARAAPATTGPKAVSQSRCSSTTPAIKGNAAMQAPREWLQRLAGWDWKWVLPGLSAVALVAYLIAFRFVGIEYEQSAKPDTSEQDRRQESAIAVTGRIDALAPERPETPVEQPILGLVPTAADPQIHAPPGDGGGSEGLKLSPPQAASTMASREATGDEPRDRGAPGAVEGPAKSPPENPMSSEKIPAGVQVLLAKAESALSRNRLTVPAGDNAYGHYRSVLALDPNNARARAGVQRIVRLYRELAKQRLTEADPSGARRYASRGLKISPRDSELLAIKRQASHEAPELLGRIERWFRSGRTDNSLFLDQ